MVTVAAAAKYDEEEREGDNSYNRQKCHIDRSWRLPSSYADIPVPLPWASSLPNILIFT